MEMYATEMQIEKIILAAVGIVDPVVSFDGSSHNSCGSWGGKVFSFLAVNCKPKSSLEYTADVVPDNNWKAVVWI